MDDVSKLVHAALMWIDGLELPLRANAGICNLVDGYLINNIGSKEYYDSGVEYEVDILLLSLFEEWPKYSGKPAFPIPGDVTAYLSLPLWEGEYGALREELLQFLIEQTNG